MADTVMDSRLRFCYSCLTDDYESVQCYAWKGFLRTIMGSIIPLCRYCMEAAENAEKIITNIQCNQTLIQRPNITAEIIKIHKIQYQENLHVFTPKVSSSRTLEIEPKPLSNEVKVEPENEEDNYNESMKDNFGNDSEMLKKEKDDEDYTELKLLCGEIEEVNEEQPKGVKRKKGNKFPTQEKKTKTIEETRPSASNAVDDNGGDKDERKGRKIKSTEIEKVHLTSEQIKEVIQGKAKNVHYIDSVFKCTSCTKGYNVKEKFEEHMEKHDTKSGPYICQYCTQRFQYHELLLRHLPSHTVRYKCVVCGKIGTGSFEMMNHYEINHNDNTSNDRTYKQYKCDQCPKSFKGRRGLYEHTKFIHKDQARVTCHICQKNSKNKVQLQKHMLIVHTDKSSKNVCVYCGKAFPSPSSLKHHIPKHTKIKDFYCVECDMSFKSQYTLNIHLKFARAHMTSISVLKFVCDNCEKRFKSKTALTRHINTEHLKIRPYKCDQCENTYTDPWDLKLHIKLTHSLEDVRIFQCTMCEKSFKMKSVLNSHMRTHTGVKPHHCTECPGSFARASTLNMHIKRIHLKLNDKGEPKDRSLRK